MFFCVQILILISVKQFVCVVPTDIAQCIVCSVNVVFFQKEVSESEVSSADEEDEAHITKHGERVTKEMVVSWVQSSTGEVT